MSKANNNWNDRIADLPKNVSERGLYLKGLRLRARYTQAQLAALIDIFANNISAMERGKRTIGKNMAFKLASVFNVQYQRFL